MFEEMEYLLVSMPCCGEVERLNHTGVSRNGNEHELIYEGTHGEKLTVICKIQWRETDADDAIRELRSQLFGQTGIKESQPDI